MAPSTDPLRRMSKSRILLYVALQLSAFGSTFAITQTIVPPRTAPIPVSTPAVGLPAIILLLIPLQTPVVPQMPFSPEELSILNRHTASPFVRVSRFLFAARAR
ncbi:hypothetical protein V8E53_010634 [Lactarius tabidus]